MNYSIEKDAGPAYLQLYRQIRDDIIAGVYENGCKLPSKRLLAEETGTSIITTEHAYSLLCDEGYAEAKQRIGFIVIFRKADGFFSSGESDDFSAHDYSLTEGVTFPFSVYAKAARKVLTECGEAVLSRTPGKGCNELRQAISRYLAASRGIKAKPEQIIIGSGAEYIYRLIIEMLGRDRKFAIEDPSYEKIGQVYDQAGVYYEKLALGKDGIESEALLKSDAEILHVSPYRSYPSGVTASASKRHEYIRWAEKNNRIVIEDDYESEFSISTKPEETLFEHTKMGNVIYLNSFSMTVASGVRTGYAVLPEQLLPRFEEKVSFYSCTVPTFDQLILAELIASGAFERHINRTRRARRKKASE